MYGDIQESIPENAPIPRGISIWMLIMLDVRKPEGQELGSLSL